MNIIAVQSQHQQHRLESNPFVPIHKGMVRNEGVPQRSRFAEEIRIEILSSEGSLRPIDGGFQQALITQTEGSTAPLDDLLIEVEDLVGVKVLHALANRLRSA